MLVLFRGERTGGPGGPGGPGSPYRNTKQQICHSLANVTMSVAYRSAVQYTVGFACRL